MPKTETLAPNQGQKRSRAVPRRSLSSIVLRPLTSMPPRVSPAVVGVGVAPPRAQNGFGAYLVQKRVQLLHGGRTG